MPHTADFLVAGPPKGQMVQWFNVGPSVVRLSNLMVIYQKQSKIDPQLIRNSIQKLQQC